MFDPNYLTKTPVILVSIFFIITYFISAFEKLTDWSGTLAYMTDHFRGTILKNIFKYGLILLVFLEVIITFVLLFGVYKHLFISDITYLFIGFILSSLSIFIMLIGQRIAKDFIGATSLTTYFILNIIGLYLLTV